VVGRVLFFSFEAKGGSQGFPVHLTQVLLLTAVCPPGVNCDTDGSVESHLAMGKKLLAAGQLADALSHFHAAVGKGQHATTHLL
jgi:hypothetical protein